MFPAKPADGILEGGSDRREVTVRFFAAAVRTMAVNLRHDTPRLSSLDYSYCFRARAGIMQLPVVAGGLPWAEEASTSVAAPKRWKWLGAIMTALIIAGVCWHAWPGRAQAPLPGSEEDPLVSKSYLESYLAARYGPLAEEIARLSARVAALERQVKELEQASGKPPSGALQVVLRVGSRTAYIGGNPQTLAQPPLLEGDIVMVPFRFIGEALGAEVTWDAKNKTIAYRLGGNHLVFVSGQPWVEVNGERRPLEAAPRLVGGVTMVPLRVVGQYLGATVRWDGSKKEVTITR
ncbi:MAG: copper amine oxidase N-terminal domain-containing protein [Clostridia bacterium]|nr:copper amine oxidase N-terminal domain-containing protein [Clostridia bacterium]